VIDLKTVWLTATVAATTAVVSVVGLLQPDVREALQREPGEVGEGEVWRLITSLLVHDRWMALASNIVVLVIVGATFEREPTMSRRITATAHCSFAVSCSRSVSAATTAQRNQRKSAVIPT